MVKDTTFQQDLETETVVIGGGGAGLAAAVAAAEKGASVIVLEKRRAPGGNSAMAEGFFAAESPAQKRMMIDAQRDELFKIAMSYAHWAINPRIVRAFVDKSGDTVRWLEEKGLKFDWIPALYPNQVIRTWHCLKGRRGVAIIKALAKDCEKLGVRMLCQAAAKRILPDDKGKVTGVLAATKEKELRITTKSVIIATGGYGGNRELLKKYYPSYAEDMFCIGLSLKGDGLLMATEIGAATEGLGILQLIGPRPRGSEHISAVVSEPNMVWVNKKGERFADEAINFNFPEAANAVDRQPDKISYTLFDAEIKRSIVEEGLIKGLGHIVPQGTKLTELEKELRLEADRREAKISDSWDGIARWIGVLPQVLKTTINEYNSFCDQGYDRIFAKDRRYLVPLCTPPYYAIRCYSCFLGTIGGIKINHHMEVLDHQDNPIPGLYAAGSDTGGWESNTYCAVLSGGTFGFAINSGRLAGENAVKYALANK